MKFGRKLEAQGFNAVEVILGRCTFGLCIDEGIALIMQYFKPDKK